MMRHLDKNQSRLLAIGLLVLSLTIALSLVIVPTILLYQHYDDAIDAQTDALTRYQRVAASSDAVRATLSQVQSKQSRRHFLNNTGSALAASEIQEIAKNSIATSGGKLSSLQVLSPQDEGGYRRIAINIQMTTGLTALRKILFAVESMQPYLLVDNLSMQSLVNASHKSVAGVEPELNVQFDLAGYALIAEGK
jgi:general secretion pathway protein M